jgi:hypothetical protein
MSELAQYGAIRKSEQQYQHIRRGNGGFERPVGKRGVRAEQDVDNGTGSQNRRNRDEPGPEG